MSSPGAERCHNARSSWPLARDPNLVHPHPILGIPNKQGPGTGNSEERE